MATIEGNGIRLQDATDGSDPDDLLLTGFIFPDNPQHTIPAFVYRSTKDRIQQSASNVGPPPSSNEPSFSIRKTKAAGKGLFATKALKIGDLIFSERPIVVTRAVRFSISVVTSLKATLGILSGFLSSRIVSSDFVYETTERATSTLARFA